METSLPTFVTIPWIGVWKPSIQPGRRETWAGRTPGGLGTHLPPVSAREGWAFAQGPTPGREQMFSSFCTGNSPLKFQVTLTAETQALVPGFPLCCIDSPGHRAHFINCSWSPGVASSALLAITQICRKQRWMGRGTAGPRWALLPVTHSALLPGAAQRPGDALVPT